MYSMLSFAVVAGEKGGEESEESKPVDCARNTQKVDYTELKNKQKK